MIKLFSLKTFEISIHHEISKSCSFAIKQITSHNELMSYLRMINLCIDLSRKHPHALLDSLLNSSQCARLLCFSASRLSQPRCALYASLGGLQQVFQKSFNLFLKPLVTHCFCFANSGVAPKRVAHYTEPKGTHKRFFKLFCDVDF